jgi:hypothetical protein
MNIVRGRLDMSPIYGATAITCILDLACNAGNFMQHTDLLIGDLDKDETLEDYTPASGLVANIKNKLSKFL